MVSSEHPKLPQHVWVEDLRSFREVLLLGLWRYDEAYLWVSHRTYRHF